MAEKIVRACGGDVAGLSIGVLGLAFKPNTDDMREAPSLVILPALQAAGASIVAHDPEAMTHAAAMLPGVAMAASAFDVVADADALVILTEWDAYRALDMRKVRAAMRGDVVVDLRNVYRPDAMAALGFRYDSVGRPKHAART